MKNISRFFVAALALIGVTSCNTAPVEEVSLSTTTITASFADSRTTLSEGVKTLWAEYDAIEVNGVTFTLKSGAGEATAVFESTTPLAAAESYTATYPAGVSAIAKSQIALAGTFDPEAALAEATGSDANNLVFEHRHALLKFELAAPASKVEIAGYEIAAPNGQMEAQTAYYLAVEAGTYAGLTATVDGVAVKSTESSVEVANGKILNLGTLPNGTAAEQKGIRTAADLVAFAANPAGDEYKDENGVVNILADIDMKDVAWTPITDFAGTLDGNNHTIDNLVVTDATHAAMFKNLSGATIQNIVFGEGCSFTATSTSTTYAGAVVGQVLTGATFKNINTYATLSGASMMGGICGAADKKAEDILFEDCVNHGAITFPAVAATSDVKLGGICGASEINVVYRNCTNNGAITDLSTDGNKYNIIGGIVGGGSDFMMYNCANTGALKYDVRGANNLYFGGICGRNHRSELENCSNTGTMVVTDDTTCNSIYAGGMLGTSEGTASKDAHYYKCHNGADISIACNNSANILIGGIVGYFREDGVYIDSCTNSGDITYSTTITNSMAGGIMGYAGMKDSSKTSRNACIYNCENTGDIKFYHTVQASSWMKPAGIVGATNGNLISIDGCINRGTVTVDYLTRAIPGGIISECKSDVKNCVNYGAIIVPDTHVDYYGSVAGIASRTQADCTISGCINYGTIVYAGKGFTNVNANKGIVGQGGIVGLLEYGTVDSCENYGVVLGNDYDESYGKASYLNAKGAIVGWGGAAAAVTIKNCKVGGSLGACLYDATDFGASAAAAITADNYADYIYGGDAGKGVTVTDCVFGTAAN